MQNPLHLSGSPAQRAEIYDSAALASLAPLRSLVERGIPLAFGADQSGDGMSPFLNVMIATTHPANPKEALTREQADSFTVPAQALPATHSARTIIGGKIAYDELTAPAVPSR